ncbi:MAG: Bro-N domain-containing protein [Salinivirgaceae bacterium]|nr:Bro-N domain-containing protein [Salinivirgaceae bacterium]
MQNNQIQLFENRKIRSQWNDDDERWYFSVVDVVAVLTDQENARSASTYWAVLKKRLIAEGANQLLTNCKQLKMLATDGKMRLTDVADTEQLLRIIQSIPSKKAEPFKQWLAKVGSDILDESVDPELTIDRAIKNYRRIGYSENWINQRIKSIEVRKALTDEWDRSGVKQGQEYAYLTDLMYRTWADMSTKEYKRLKGLKKENLRDNMTNIELILNMLAEASATELSQKSNPKNLDESTMAAISGAEVARDARLSLEERGGETISPKNAKELGNIRLPFNELPNNDDDF